MVVTGFEPVAFVIPAFPPPVAFVRLQGYLNHPDNNSTDRTAAVARAAGALVRAEPLQGKGNVVRHIFADMEADVYVLVDGDDTTTSPARPSSCAASSPSGSTW